MRQSTWGRADTRLLQGLLGLAFVIQALIGLVIPFLSMAGLLNTAIVRDVPIAGVVGNSLVEDGGAKLTVSESATLNLTDPSLGERVLLNLPAVFDTVLILLGLYWLFLVARTLSAGEPFAPRNPKRLFGIAVLIAVGSLGDSLLTTITNHELVAGTRLQDYVPFSLHISFLPLGVAVLVAALAEAFRIGVRLRADTEGLV
jgi:hypothetical protein